MRLLVNGEETHIENEKSLSELLQQLGYRGETFAVALNGDFVPRGNYPHTLLSAGDCLDIVAPVVGG
ncbi:sulfur carrier protein ThiS [Microbulbifer sp. Q7]|uniref:sulfur carrier protein ThiS n=1 Tax=Microbulbifer sp. Q7 TaxID=1785091 RepID=UPI00082C98AE|nr:sulfur carrier protein ThiS [Microbulbifer sp. Q7]